MTFNAKSARAKRPLPLWVDAFQRDTQHLAADEVGSYLLILMAMWTRETCDFPDDDRRLAAVCRVSVRLWRSRIGPIIRDFLEAENGVLFSQRLRKEATYVERHCEAQSNRKNGEKSDKPLKYNDVVSTADISTDMTVVASPDQPTQQPNNPTEDGGGGSAHAREAEILPDRADRTDREIVLEAIGADPVSGLIGPNGTQLGRVSDMLDYRRWRDDLGLSRDEVIAVIRDVMSAKPDGAPSRFSYFNQPMQRFAGHKARGALIPIEGEASDRRREGSTPQDRGSTAAGRAHQGLITAFARAISDEPGGV